MLMPGLLPLYVGRMGIALTLGFREPNWSISDDTFCRCSSISVVITLFDELSLAARAFILKGGS